MVTCEAGVMGVNAGGVLVVEALAAAPGRFSQQAKKGIRPRTIMIRYFMTLLYAGGGGNGSQNFGCIGLR